MLFLPISPSLPSQVQDSVDFYPVFTFPQHILLCEICFCLNLQTVSFPLAVALQDNISGHLSGIRAFRRLVRLGNTSRKQARGSPEQRQTGDQ